MAFHFHSPLVGTTSLTPLSSIFSKLKGFFIGHFFLLDIFFIGQTEGDGGEANVVVSKSGGWGGWGEPKLNPDLILKSETVVRRDVRQHKTSFREHYLCDRSLQRLKCIFNKQNKSVFCLPKVMDATCFWSDPATTSTSLKTEPDNIYFSYNQLLGALTIFATSTQIKSKYSTCLDWRSME